MLQHVYSCFRCEILQSSSSLETTVSKKDSPTVWFVITPFGFGWMSNLPHSVLSLLPATQPRVHSTGRVCSSPAASPSAKKAARCWQISAPSRRRLQSVPTAPRTCKDWREKKFYCTKPTTRPFGEVILLVSGSFTC